MNRRRFGSSSASQLSEIVPRSMAAWRSTRTICLALVAAGLILTPAGAAEKPNRHVIPGSFGISADLPKSHGYSISVVVSGHKEVEVLAYRRNSFASFETKGRADGSGLQADFGRYGQLELSFEPRGEAKEESEPGCEGRPSITQEGVFRGVVRFHGERDFIAVATDRVKGSVSQSFRRVCSFGGGAGGNGINVIGVGEPRLAPEPESRDEEFSVLQVSRRAKGRQTFLSAIGLLSEPSASQVVAGAIERVGPVEVGRFNMNWGKSRRPVSFSEPGAEPVTVSVEPHGAFLGRARYEKRSGRRAHWSGDLRTLLPGLGPVALTGPGFHATLCQTTPVDGAEGCRRG